MQYPGGIEGGSQVVLMPLSVKSCFLAFGLFSAGGGGVVGKVFNIVETRESKMDSPHVGGGTLRD